jgi:hypothetical protein
MLLNNGRCGLHFLDRVGDHFVRSSDLIPGTIGRIFNDRIHALHLVFHGLRNAGEVLSCRLKSTDNVLGFAEHISEIGQGRLSLRCDTISELFNICHQFPYRQEDASEHTNLDDDKNSDNDNEDQSQLFHFALH